VRLKVFFYDPDSQLWAHHTKSVIDTTAQTVTVMVDKLLGEHDPIGLDY